MIVVTASPNSPAQPPAFAEMCRTHYRAAARLTPDKALWPAADHLAGLAAECAIKAILLDFLGSRLNEHDRPFHPREKIRDPSKKRPHMEHGHLPGLWEQLTALAHRRKDAAAGVLFTQLVWENPFDDWCVTARYGASITQESLDRHLMAAYDLIAAHEHARLLGAGTLV